MSRILYLIQPFFTAMFLWLGNGDHASIYMMLGVAGTITTTLTFGLSFIWLVFDM